MIRVFSSITDKEPSEVHKWTGSIRGWMCANIDDFDPAVVAPFAVEVNGSILPREQWGREVGAHDVVDITVQPQGVELLIAGITLRETFRPLINALQPDIPGTPDAGRSLELAEAKANTARLGGVVPEVFGEFRRYPDYLLPPRKFFATKRTQTNRLFMCVGVGEYDVDISSVRVGESLLTSIDGATYQIYAPGADVSSDPAAEWWHTSTEIGGTSTGNAGIPLKKTSNVSDFPEATAFTFNGDEISIPGGAGSFPAGWDAGLTLRVEQYLDYEIEAGGARDIIRGPLDQLGPFVGMKIEIAGDNEGLYEIHSYTAGSTTDPGSASTLTASAAPARYDFDVTPVTFTLSLNGTGQEVTLNTDVINLSGLLSAINGQIDGTIDAQDDGGGQVQIVEQGPTYTGEPITVTGDTTDVFGSSPVGVTGDPTVTVPAEITLSYDNGDPVTGFTPDAARMAIGYEGMLYLVDGATTSTIELTRLDDEGDPDVSWPGFDTITTTDAVIFVSGESATTGWAGPFIACPDGETTETIEYDVFFPGGLAYLDSKGRVLDTNQYIDLEWREAGSGDPWTRVSETIRDGTLDQIGFTYTVSLPSAIRPEVRMRRRGDGDAAKAKRNVEWYALRSKLAAPTSYPWTTMSVELENASQISAQSEQQINLIPERKIPVLVAGNWTAGNFATRDIIPAVRYMAETVGMPYDNDALVELDTLYKSRGDYFDYVFNETTVRDAIKKALRAGMAELTLEDGAIKPVREGVRTVFEQAFSPQNMTEGGLSRSFSSVRPDDADGVDVEYTGGESWTQETVECRLPGDAGNKVETIKLDGVTDRTRAWRIGMRYRRELKYRRWEYRFNTELEGLNAGYKSYVPLLDDIPGYGQSSIMRSIVADGSSAKITVTEDMDWTGTGHVVAFRNEYGELMGPYSATIGNNNREIIAAIPMVDWPDVSARQEPPHVYFGTAEKWTFPALVTDVEPSGGLQVGIRAVNYDERVYADDDNSPPE